MKEILKIKGGNILNGEVSIGGAKNSLVALIPASIVTKSVVKLENIKPIDDTYTLIKILEYLNVKVLYDDRSVMYIDARHVKNKKLVIPEMINIRASYYFIGALLSMYSNVSSLGPGGCNFGERPIDLHIKAFNDLGFECNKDNDLYSFNKKNRRKKEIVFSKKSVGATINAIIASCKISGSVVLKNCALEPEVDEIICFLNKCGCFIKRDKGNIEIVGAKKLHGCDYKVMSDRIEAGTFMIIGAALANNLKISNVNCEHLKSVIQVLQNIGVRVDEYPDCIVVKKEKEYKAVDVLVDSYPGFPTDLQQPLSVLLCLCNGKSTIKETIYPARLSHIESLNKMNANIVIEDNVILIEGNKTFKSSDVSGKDLRGGISLVIAALLADGVSNVDGVKYIKRGYSDLVYKLNKIGADIRMEKVYEQE